MENLKALSEEKRKALLEAGFQCFGKVGYKKASTADIAKAAGISKAMIFHYFGTKKAMYTYLVKEASKEIIEALQKGYAVTTDDFFERVITLSKFKVEVLKKYPALLSFLTNVCKEDAPEIAEDVRMWLESGDNIRSDLVLTDVDSSKFKSSVQPELVLELVVGYSLGAFGRNSSTDQNDLDKMMEKLTDCLMMLKNNFYREEFL